MVGNTRLSKAVMVLELVLVLMAAVRFTSATQYKVGDADGWRIGAVNYTTWAAPKKFYVGDYLLFVYNKAWHNVLQVSEADYDSCKNSTPIATWEGGSNILPLSKTGLYYYLCGITGHCEAGQKVAINVLAANSSAAAPSSSPETAPSPTPAASKTHKSPASSPSSSATSGSISKVPASAPASKSSAHAKSAGSALLAFAWALGALLFCQ